MTPVIVLLRVVPMLDSVKSRNNAGTCFET
jgi:hypothetical protein